LNKFSRTFPGVKIDIEFMDSEQAYELIGQGKVELAVVTLAPNSEESIIAEAVWSDPLDFMVSVGHILATQKNCDLKFLSQCPAILPGLNTYTGQIVKRLFDRHDLQLQVSMATNYLETVRMMASVGLGWTVLPRSMIDESLRAIDVPGDTIERTLGLVYHRGRTLSRAALAFNATLRHFSDEP
jgi:DNA-binding transcriptional LysR family regulator